MSRQVATACALMAVVTLPAQRTPIFEVRRLGPEDGLSNRHVTAVMQDGFGFIWAGTVSGLDRFDGHSFRNWSLPNGLRNSRVDALRRDAKGRIWVFSADPGGGLASIDLAHAFAQRITPIEHDAARPPVPLPELSLPGPQQADGTLLLGAQNPARCLRLGTNGQWRVFPLEGDRFHPLGTDRNGSVIGHLAGPGDEQRIVKVDTLGALQVTQRLAPGAKVEVLVSGRATPGAFYRIEEPSGAMRYFDTYSELDIGSEGDRWMHWRTEGDPVRKPMNITPLPQHGLLMSDTRIVDPSGHVQFDLARSRPEVNGRVKDLVLDRSGDVWLATEFGLFHVQVHADVFERILHREHIPEGTGILCRGMAWHQGALYLATEWDGAFVLKENGGRWTAEERPSPKYLFAAHVDRQGVFWRGGPGVLVSEDPAGQVGTYEVPDEIWSILGMPGGTLLLGGTKGLHRFDPLTGVSLPVEDPDHPSLRQAHVLQLERVGEVVMAVSSKGIFVLGPDGAVLDHYHAQAEGRSRLPYDNLHHVHFGSDGIWWLATRGAGLMRFDPATGDLKSFTMRTGFPNNMVYAALPDRHGQLWLPTDGGLVRFDLETHQTVLFTARDGLAHDEFNRLAHTRAPDGRLFFGGLNGITVVDPAQFVGTLEDSQYSMVFTSLLCRTPGGSYEDRSAELLSSEGISLDPSENAIQVSFALLSFQAADRMLYAWRIAGLDDTWNYTATPSLHLHHLPHGRYALEVKARNAKGQWSARSIVLPIRVGTPWRAQWSVWLALGVMISVAAVGGAGLYGTRRRRKPLRCDPQR